VWFFGRYLIGPLRVMRALLFSISTNTCGGPKVAMEADRNVLFWQVLVISTEKVQLLNCVRVVLTV